MHGVGLDLDGCGVGTDVDEPRVGERPRQPPTAARVVAMACQEGLAGLGHARVDGCRRVGEVIEEADVGVDGEHVSESAAALGR